MLCWFLRYDTRFSCMCTYKPSIWSLPPTPDIPAPAHHRALSWAPGAMQQLPASSLFTLTGHCRRCKFNPWIGRAPGGGNSDPLQCPCLENAMDRGAWWAAVHGVSKSQTCLADWAGRSTHSVWASVLLSRFIPPPSLPRRILIPVQGPLPRPVTLFALNVCDPSFL